MEAVFYISAAVAIIATVLVITEVEAVHALLYLIVSLLAVALAFYALGAPFIAALEVIIYAGAIMVLFLFLIMMLTLGRASAEQESRLLGPRSWLGPALLVLVLFGELIFVFAGAAGQTTGLAVVEPAAVGVALFGPYALGVELASLLLLAGLVGAYHMGRRDSPREGGGGENG